MERSEKKLLCPDMSVLFCIGSMLKPFLLGWDEDECYKVMRYFYISLWIKSVIKQIIPQVYNFVTDHLQLSQSVVAIPLQLKKFPSRIYETLKL